MKLITLNVWGGRQHEPLMQFIVNAAKDTDVFCFQEVFHFEHDIPLAEEARPLAQGIRPHLFEELSQALHQFHGLFAPSFEGFDAIDSRVDFNLAFGLAIFVRNTVGLLEEGDIFVYGDRGNNPRTSEEYLLFPRNLAYVAFELAGKAFTIATLHGLWTPTKADTAARLEQSRRAKQFLDSRSGEVILCGDFNLSPETQSMAILEHGMCNLIREHKVATTRSVLYTGMEPFADYVLVSAGVEVKDFQVLPDPVSDHLPLVLEFT